MQPGCSGDLKLLAFQPDCFVNLQDILTKHDDADDNAVVPLTIGVSVFGLVLMASMAVTFGLWYGYHRKELIRKTTTEKKQAQEHQDHRKPHEGHEHRQHKNAPRAQKLWVESDSDHTEVLLIPDERLDKTQRTVSITSSLTIDRDSSTVDMSAMQPGVHGFLPQDQLSLPADNLVQSHGVRPTLNLQPQHFEIPVQIESPDQPRTPVCNQTCLRFINNLLWQ